MHDLGVSIEVFVDSVQNGRAITYLEKLHVLGFSVFGTLMRGFNWSNFQPRTCWFQSYMVWVWTYEHLFLVTHQKQSLLEV